MALDQTFVLRDAAVGGANGTNTNNVALTANTAGTGGSGLYVTLGRRGLPQGAQFITVVAGNVAGSPAAADATTYTRVDCDLSLDNGTTWRTIARHEYPQTFNGQRSSDITQDFNAQEYANANILVRSMVTPFGANSSNNTQASKLAAYIGAGEPSHYGRKATADTLLV